MAIKTIDDTNLVAIADAIRAKGVEGTWKPSEMATAIASISGGGGVISNYLGNLLADTENYGITKWNSGSSATARLTLPDGITFDDIVYLVALGGTSNSGSSSRSTRVIPYIYCPVLYDDTIETTYFNGGIGHICTGFGLGVYGTTEEIGVFLGRLPDGTWKYNTYNSCSIAVIGPYASDLTKIATQFMDVTEAPPTLYGSFALAKYGDAMAIYKKKK